jgi:hypothetical protein
MLLKLSFAQYTMRAIVCELEEIAVVSKLQEPRNT